MNRMAAISLAAALLCACGGTTATQTPNDEASLAGTYECLQPGASEPDHVVLSADGTQTITHPDGVTEAGTWSVDGEAGFFGSKDQGEPFTVVDGRLRFGDTTECTRQE